MASVPMFSNPALPFLLPIWLPDSVCPPLAASHQPGSQQTQLPSIRRVQKQIQSTPDQRDFSQLQEKSWNPSLMLRANIFFFFQTIFKKVWKKYGEAFKGIEDVLYGRTSGEGASLRGRNRAWWTE